MPVEMDEETLRVTRAREFLRVLRRSWYIVVIALVIGAGVGYGWARTQKEQYSCTVLAFLTTSDSANLGTQLTVESLIQSKTQQYADFAASRKVAETAIKRSGANLTVDQALQNLEVTIPKGTPQLSITVKAGTAKESAALADAWVNAMNDQISQVEGEPAKATPSPSAAKTAAPSNSTGLDGTRIQIRQYAEAQAPAAPSYPNRKLSAATGSIISALLALLVLYIRSLLDRRIRNAEIIQDRMDITVLGTIPLNESISNGQRLMAESEAVGTVKEGFQIRESFKELRTNLRFMNPDHPMRIITVTSSLPAEGKSTVAANVAIALAEEGRPVILLDGDLRRPTVAQSFGLVSTVGICNVIVGDVEAEDVLQEVSGYPNLYIMVAGDIPPNPSELLSSDRFEQIVRKFAEDYMVIIDAPPLLAVTDAAIIAARFQGALLVVSAESSKLDELQQAVRNLQKVNAPVIGAVLNRVPRKGADSRAYQYYGKDYDYYMDKESEDGSPVAGAKKLLRRSKSQTSQPESASSPVQVRRAVTVNENPEAALQDSAADGRNGSSALR